MMSDGSPTAQRESRLSVRISEADKRLLIQAAQARHMSMSQFVLEASLRAARTIVTDQAEFRLPPEHWEAFCRQLDAPPRTFPALRRLFGEADLL